MNTCTVPLIHSIYTKWNHIFTKCEIKKILSRNDLKKFELRGFGKLAPSQQSNKFLPMAWAAPFTTKPLKWLTDTFHVFTLSIFGVFSKYGISISTLDSKDVCCYRFLCRYRTYLYLFCLLVRQIYKVFTIHVHCMYRCAVAVLCAVAI